MKKIIVSGLILSSLLTSSVTAFAWWGNGITDSGHWTNKTSYGGIYAYGFTESDSKHYTTARLSCSNGQIRTSDRQWGTGRVDASTEHMEYSDNESYNSAVYYGFN